jgi:hypothetical protein
MRDGLITSNPRNEYAMKATCFSLPAHKRSSSKSHPLRMLCIYMRAHGFTQPSRASHSAAYWGLKCGRIG